uniref:Uncharacterized protein n=1 Tax=Leptocylindrus danicus TaxID=163516 RepID=A0A7S2KQQ3_9STRA|mmetsp:Transcript_25556/g.38153  ORF Transcript_25556/g.38153 Transcript_25556/m.38153 type:complete len:197 (+) Transcript_25556:268-858(+)
MSEESRAEVERFFSKSNVSSTIVTREHERKVIMGEQVSDQSMRDVEALLSLPKNTFVGKEMHDSSNVRPQVSEEEEESSSTNENLFTVKFSSGNEVSVTISDACDSLSVACANNCDIFVIEGTTIGAFLNRLIDLAEEDNESRSFVISSYANKSSYFASMVDGSVSFSGIGCDDLQIFLNDDDLRTCLFELIGRAI